MVILKITCSNIFMFDSFSLDFTYGKKLKHISAQNDALFEGSAINVRKKIIILGGNASGKTTFGRLICYITNYLISGDPSYLMKASYQKNKDSRIYIEFAIEKEIYSLTLEFNYSGILFEKLAKVKSYKSYTIEKVRNLLETTKHVWEYKKSENEEYKKESVLFHKYDSLKSYFKQDVKFMFSFSDYIDKNTPHDIRISVEKINDILPKIDNSVDKVLKLQVSDNSVDTASYIIIFKNGENLTIPDGKLIEADNKRLSHGTYEAIDFLNTLFIIYNSNNSIIYLDEKLAHVHAELETYLVMKACLANNDNQLFFTTHNPELFDLNLSNNSFLLFKRCNTGYNTAFFANSKINKDDRSLRNYYENDLFSVLPDYSDLDNLFEEI